MRNSVTVGKDNDPAFDKALGLSLGQQALSSPSLATEIMGFSTVKVADSPQGRPRVDPGFITSNDPSQVKDGSLPVRRRSSWQTSTRCSFCSQVLIRLKHANSPELSLLWCGGWESKIPEYLFLTVKPSLSIETSLRTERTGSRSRAPMYVSGPCKIRTRERTTIEMWPPTTPPHHARPLNYATPGAPLQRDSAVCSNWHACAHRRHAACTPTTTRAKGAVQAPRRGHHCGGFNGQTLFSPAALFKFFFFFSYDGTVS
ncbi:hypothetical protein HPB48_002806 [Haemaphysalis longicornis]|uniref:Uncharacterized protein n=1 Tax=Haemaphysalis longicornis TaxID=44386 RepID=A0A9J6GEL7_HAELO|nr:hypothetical protein HPB48_002806 [Haemaphysalis longicornis]